jgi:NAD(P)-dependent dehydrogenase (short-subunit alcohol dehydrogenase family)
MKNLNGKVAFLTGAGSGIGRALAVSLAENGVIPALADINEEGLRETVEILRSRGKTATTHVLDIRDPESFQRAADDCVSKHGGVDILINNAGVLSRNVSFLEMDLDHQRFVFDVNFWGMVNGVRAFVPYLAQRPEASLVNLSSSLAICGAPFHSAYCASKAAVMEYSEIMRIELSRSNIFVTIVMPGAAKTNLGANVAAASAEESAKTAKNFEKFASTTPEAVAAAVIKGVKKRKPRVVTGMDGKSTVALAGWFPSGAHKLMGWAYRKVGDPDQFKFIDAISAGKPTSQKS